MRDDLIPADHPVIKEALSRLTDKEIFDRTFRIRRAAQLFMAHEELPVNEQISFENDQPYLWKHLMNVCKERDERSLLDKIGSEIQLEQALSHEIAEKERVKEKEKEKKEKP